LKSEQKNVEDEQEVKKFNEKKKKKLSKLSFLDDDAAGDAGSSLAKYSISRKKPTPGVHLFNSNSK